MNAEQVKELRTYFEDSISRAGRIDAESLSKALLRATEMVIEEREVSRWQKLENWRAPTGKEDPISHLVLRIANPLPGRGPIINGLLCSLIIFLIVGVSELLLFGAFHGFWLLSR
jgi:hypothetical protein